MEILHSATQLHHHLRTEPRSVHTLLVDAARRNRAAAPWYIADTTPTRARPPPIFMCGGGVQTVR